jgi:hypothetical protein
MKPSTGGRFIAKPFLFFDQSGACDFPSKDLVRSNANRGVVTALVLDANVCLNLANYTQGLKDADMDSRIRQFLLAVELNKVDVVPFFGCLELASARNSDRVNLAQLSGIASNVSFALQQSEHSIARGQRPHMANLEKFVAANESITAIYPMLRYAYCAFLKIIEIRMRGHLKDRAAKNIVEFLEWCETMTCCVGLLTQAAFAVLGGERAADRLLSVRIGKTPLDAAWGAAWDFWYSWMIQNYFPTHPLDAVAQHTIFVTDDAAAAFIAGQCKPSAVFLAHDQPFLSISGINYGFPYYADKLDRLSSLIATWRERNVKRVALGLSKGESIDHDLIEKEIIRLEPIVMMSN